MTGRRVVVTGLGMVAPVGLDVKSSWENILAGKSGIKPITHFDIEPFSVHFGGPIYDFDITQYISKKDSRKMDKFIHYGLAAELTSRRQLVLHAIYQKHPERFVKGLPRPPKLPSAVWINPPRENSEEP